MERKELVERVEDEEVEAREAAEESEGGRKVEVTEAERAAVGAVGEVGRVEVTEGEGAEKTVPMEGRKEGEGAGMEEKQVVRKRDICKIFYYLKAEFGHSCNLFDLRLCKSTLFGYHP